MADLNLGFSRFPYFFCLLSFLHAPLLLEDFSVNEETENKIPQALMSFSSFLFFFSLVILKVADVTTSKSFNISLSFIHSSCLVEKMNNYSEYVLLSCRFS